MQSTSPPAAPEARTSAEAVAPLEAVPPAAAEALIAEARERSRRPRRRRTATAAMIVAAAVGGGLVVTGVLDGGRTTGGGPGRPLPLAARTGEVTGYLDPCIGMVLPGRQDTPAFAAGTVTALRGRQTWRRTGDGYYQLQLPATAPTARQHVAKNQAFALNLPPGGYTLVARYDNGNGLNVITVTVRAGQVIRQNFPDICK
jgi:hypothetical protein